MCNIIGQFIWLKKGNFCLNVSHSIKLIIHCSIAWFQFVWFTVIWNKFFNPSKDFSLAGFVYVGILTCGIIIIRGFIIWTIRLILVVNEQCFFRNNKAYNRFCFCEIMKVVLDPTIIFFIFVSPNKSIFSIDYLVQKWHFFSLTNKKIKMDVKMISNALGGIHFAHSWSFSQITFCSWIIRQIMNSWNTAKISLIMRNFSSMDQLKILFIIW